MKTAIQLAVCFAVSAVFVLCATGGSNVGVVAQKAPASCGACSYLQKLATTPGACTQCPGSSAAQAAH